MDFFLGMFTGAVVTYIGVCIWGAWLSRTVVLVKKDEFE